MTYGKWKALHPHTEVVVALDADAKLCKICGKPFGLRVKGAGGRNQIYCSPECAYEAAKNRVRARYQKKGDVSNGKI